MTEQTAAGAPTRLEDLQAGLRLSGLLPQTVSILAVAAHGPDAVTVTFQDVNGALGQRLLYRADEAALSIESADRPLAVRRGPCRVPACRRGAADPDGRSVRPDARGLDQRG